MNKGMKVILEGIKYALDKMSSTLTEKIGKIESDVDSLKTYTDNTIAQKSQVQIITWGADD